MNRPVCIELYTNNEMHLQWMNEWIKRVGSVPILKHLSRKERLKTCTTECWALSKADARKIDALDQWCLRRILDTCWYHRVSNREVRRMTEQPPLTDIIQKRRLLLFGHLARMDETADARRILTGVHQSDWSRPVGRPYTSWMATLKSDLSLHNLIFEDAVKLALDKSLWRLLIASGAMHWHGACRIMIMMMMM